MAGNTPAEIIASLGQTQQQTQQAADQGALAGAMGGVSFGSGAFPAATQAAFGLGGSGVGYGGQATGGSISFPSAGGYVQQAAVPAGTAGTNWMPILLIGGLLLVVILVIGKGGEEIEEALGGGHRRRRRR